MASRGFIAHNRETGDSGRAAHGDPWGCRAEI